LADTEVILFSIIFKNFFLKFLDVRINPILEFNFLLLFMS
jgi:hypothetical protein